MNSTPPIKHKKHLFFSILSASVGAVVGAVVISIQHEALSVERTEAFAVYQKAGLAYLDHTLRHGEPTDFSFLPRELKDAAGNPLPPLSVSEEGTLTCELRCPPGTPPSIGNYLFPPHSPCHISIGDIVTPRQKAEQSSFSIPDLPKSIPHSLSWLHLLNTLKYEAEESSSIWVYTLHEGNCIVAVHADAMGTLHYTANCYELIDNSYRELSSIRYSSRTDFSEPTLRNGLFSVTSKKSGKTISFDIRTGGTYEE